MRHERTPARVRYLHGASAVDEHYWLSPEHLADFERRAAEQARGARAGVFGTPLVLVDEDGAVSFGPPNSATQVLPDAVEALWLMVFDIDQGFTVNRCPYTRRPNGEPVFDDVQIYQGDVRLDDTCPGFPLLQRVMASAA